MEVTVLANRSKYRRARPKQGGFLTSGFHLPSQRINDPNRPITLLRRQILRVKNRSTRLFRRLQNKGVPERSLIPHFDLESLNHSLRSVHHDLPAHVVMNEPPDFVHAQRTRDLSPQIDAKLLQHLSAQDSLRACPQFLNQIASALVLDARRTVMGIDQNVRVHEVFVRHLASTACVVKRARLSAL